jgi:hypothetical protein
MLQWPSANTGVLQYWLRVYGWYALAEAGIQLIFYFVLNHFGTQPISNIPFHCIMWVAQCLMIFPIWYVAFVSLRVFVGWQVAINTVFFVLYSFFWFGAVQAAILFVYEPLQQWLLPPAKQLTATVDSLENIDFVPYQVLKHAFRLGWFYLAYFHFSFQKEEAQKLELATANKALQLNLLKWQLNATFYDKTLNYLQTLALKNVKACTTPILQLSKLMEYVIYDARAKSVSLIREADFIRHYIDLINQQSDKVVKWKLEVSDLSDKATIAPLLIAEIIDYIGAILSTENEEAICLKIYCVSGSIVIAVNQPTLKTIQVDLFAKERLYSKLKKMYADRCGVSHDKLTATFFVRFPFQPVEHDGIVSLNSEKQILV